MTVTDSRRSDEPTTARPRYAWADAAKGLCILLVVLWHIVMKHYLQIDWRLALPLPGAWGTLGDQLLTLRMPLFFAVSGMFAFGAFHRPWRVVARSRVAKFLYLYLLWVLIHTAALWAVPDFDTASPRSFAEFAELVTITPPNSWYLYALALYFIVAKSLRRLPPALVIAAAGALSVVAAADLIATPGNRGSLLQNLVFFLAGLHLRPYLERLAANTNWRRVALTGGGYALGLLVMAATATQLTPGVWPLVSALAVVFGITVAPLVTAWPGIGPGLAWIGRRTLPIYVIHMPVVALLHVLLIGPASDAPTAVQYLLAVFHPILMTATVVAICLLLERLLLRARATWLFDLPKLTRAKVEEQAR